MSIIYYTQKEDGSVSDVKNYDDGTGQSTTESTIITAWNGLNYISGTEPSDSSPTLVNEVTVFKIKTYNTEADAQTASALPVNSMVLCLYPEEG
jgi:hypothetical protein